MLATDANAHIETVSGVNQLRAFDGESACRLYLTDEQYELARLLGDPLGACLVGVGLVPCPSQLAQAHCHALLHLAQPSLNIASCLRNTACLYSPVQKVRVLLQNHSNVVLKLFWKKHCDQWCRQVPVNNRCLYNSSVCRCMEKFSV